MKVLLKLLLGLFLILSLTIPFSIVITSCVDYPVSTILSAVWGFSSGIIAARLVL